MTTGTVTESESEMLRERLLLLLACSSLETGDLIYIFNLLLAAVWKYTILSWYVLN